ncbi:unnamed protein product, partial [Polarella glacialis]
LQWEEDEVACWQDLEVDSGFDCPSSLSFMPDNDTEGAQSPIFIQLPQDDDDSEVDEPIQTLDKVPLTARLWSLARDVVRLTLRLKPGPKDAEPRA